jgi:hypothetical protein
VLEEFLKSDFSILKSDFYSYIFILTIDFEFNNKDQGRNCIMFLEA